MSLYFYLHYLLLLAAAEMTPGFISLDLCLPNSQVDYSICELMQECV